MSENQTRTRFARRRRSRALVVLAAFALLSLLASSAEAEFSVGYCTWTWYPFLRCYYTTTYCDYVYLGADGTQILGCYRYDTGW